MSDLQNCPNCGTGLKGGLMSNIKLLDKEKIDIINLYHEKQSAGYCTKCGKDLYAKYYGMFTEEKGNLVKSIKYLSTFMPIITTHSPLNWDYNILGIVTGQSTTGTGFITEFSSSFTDLFGAQSGRHNQKIKAGEDLCFAQLKKKTIDLGGNAIIATDIDYSELGGAKAMIMVCMAGTAVKLRNTSLLGEKTEESLTKLLRFNDRLKILSKISIE